MPGNLKFLTKLDPPMIMEPKSGIGTILGPQPVYPTSLRHDIENDPPELDPVFMGLFDRGDKLTLVAPSKSRKSFFVL